MRSRDGNGVEGGTDRLKEVDRAERFRNDRESAGVVCALANLVGSRADDDDGDRVMHRLQGFLKM
jgi:hypothetical protein